jgi:hypothetical protein
MIYFCAHKIGYQQVVQRISEIVCNEKKNLQNKTNVGLKDYPDYSELTTSTANATLKDEIASPDF